MNNQKLFKIFFVSLPIFCVLISTIICITLGLTRGVNFSAYSIYPLILFIASSLIAIEAYLNKHKKNILLEPPKKLQWLYEADIWLNQRYTYTPEYLREFLWTMSLQTSSLPFYIPLILFSSNYTTIGLASLVFFIPYAFYAPYAIRKEFKRIKNERQLKKEQQEKERREQEKREESGKWK